MTASPPLEYVIAQDAAFAQHHAITCGWRRGAGQFWRPDRDGDEIPVAYCSEPARLHGLGPATRIHIGKFPGGIPAAWLKAIRHYQIVGSIAGKRVGPYKPMCSAPDDRPIMIFDGYLNDWVKASPVPGAAPAQWQAAITGAALHAPICWIEAPEPPPSVMIREIARANGWHLAEPAQ